MKKTKKKKKIQKKKQSHSTPSAAAQSAQSTAENQPKITPYPAAGKKVVEFEEKLDQHIADEQPKRGRGRPRKETMPIEPAPQVGVELVAGAIKIPFELWAINQDIEELSLNKDEAKQLAEPVKVLLDYYLPKMPDIGYAWLGLAVTSFWIFRPRLQLIQELKKQKLPPQTDAVQDGQNGQGGPRPFVPENKTKSNQFPNESELKATVI